MGILLLAFIQNVRNINQRWSLTCLRSSAHLLASELGRRKWLVTPFEQRIYVYCQTKPSSDEQLPNQTSAQGLRNAE